MSADIKSFLQVFIKEVSSDGAREALQELKQLQDRAADDSLIAETYRVEIFLCKGLRQHALGKSTNNEQEVASALSQVLLQGQSPNPGYALALALDPKVKLKLDPQILILNFSKAHDSSNMQF